eukprot:gnl/TRDRNA2_/TRDRNA2_170553_c1_seq1.p1 gnl/TRDRNA2_/TRDRNA2_170553_c1~~gnl/TRDRNA2_/TRDRNA2_170553_c1_seq1.p1  ORF type:complete len:779 (-),score=114.27 gnl/TRDRNA2_/TRDRNA2_170553_c1_seq1:34-2196(-)
MTGQRKGDGDGEEGDSHAETALRELESRASIIRPRKASSGGGPARSRVSVIQTAAVPLERSASKRASSKSLSPRRTISKEDNALERHLKEQGFFIHPPEERLGASGKHGAEQRLTVKARRKEIINEISTCIGRQVQGEEVPSADLDSQSHGHSSQCHSQHQGSHFDEFAPDDDDAHHEALREVSHRALRVTVKPEEQALIAKACRGSIRQMGQDRFKEFHEKCTQHAVDVVMKSRAEQVEVERGSRPSPITKRYLLPFFEEDRADLPWLAIMQSVLLVIMKRTPFHTPQERSAFDNGLRGFNQVRKVALRKPGLFAPVEAALWSHPVVVHLAAKVQRSVCHSDGATAWKTSLFEGCHEDSSCRDPTADVLYSQALPQDGPKLLRKLADVSGRFTVGTGEMSQTPSLDDSLLTPQQSCCFISTKTGSGVHIRAFGERELTREEEHQVLRLSDRGLDTPRDPQPRDIKIEELRLRRQRQRAELNSLSAWSTKSSEIPTVIHHGDLKAQRHYTAYAMRTEIPEKAKAFKYHLLTSYDAFLYGGIDQGTSSSSRAFASSSRSDGADGSPPRPAQSDASSPRAAQGTAAGTTPSGGSAEVVPQASSPDASLHADSSLRRSAEKGGPSGASPSQASEAPAVRKPPAFGAGFPQTVDEVGRLVEQSDALQTVLALDVTEHGGFAHRCPAGWDSGYRVEPMSKEEIRRARIVERAVAPRRNGTTLSAR